METDILDKHAVVPLKFIYTDATFSLKGVEGAGGEYLCKVL